MTSDALLAVQYVYSFAVGVGIITGGFIAFAMSLLRSRRGGLYGHYADSN